jgi:hypothetical protein
MWGILEKVGRWDGRQEARAKVSITCFERGYANDLSFFNLEIGINKQHLPIYSNSKFRF